MPARRKRSTWLTGTSANRRLWLRRTVLTLCAVALIPAVLTLVYLPPFVHPLSTLMVKDLRPFRATTAAGFRSTTFLRC